MTPIKFRIPYSGEFYYWGFIADEDGLDFIEPQYCGLPFHSVATADTLPWIMQNSERLLGCDRFGNEVYQGDYVDDGVAELNQTYLKYLSDSEIIKCRKVGNIHNIPEELK